SLKTHRRTVSSVEMKSSTRATTTRSRWLRSDSAISPSRQRNGGPTKVLSPIFLIEALDDRTVDRETKAPECLPSRPSKEAILHESKDLEFYRSLRRAFSTSTIGNTATFRTMCFGHDPEAALLCA